MSQEDLGAFAKGERIMEIKESLRRSIHEQLLEARAASRVLRSSADEQRVLALKEMATALAASHASILGANRLDMQDAEAQGLSGAMLDRLRLDEERLQAMEASLLEIADSADPIGGLEERVRRPSGIEVARMRIPLGVIAMIYEARPNVTADAAALCLRSGNAVVLRGGKEARHSNREIALRLQEGLAKASLPVSSVTLIREPEREGILAIIQADELVDLAIPRGGEGLIRFVVEHARVPVVQHYKGVCHVYVDEEADLEQAIQIVVNGKVQRPGVCNATECVLIHETVAAEFLPRLWAELEQAGVELRCDERALGFLPTAEGTVEAGVDDFGREFLALILALKVVSSTEEAIAHVERFGSKHTEAICTQNPETAARWQLEVDASCVVVNASTRFNDGGELGLGAEMGISTTKLHAYGPMGLRELTARKFVVLGEGQVRA